MTNFKYLLAMVTLTAISTTPAHSSATLDGMAFIDLSLCYGLNKPEELAKPPAERAPRIQAMDNILKNLKSEQHFEAVDNRGTFRPTQSQEALGFPVTMINPVGYGPHRGIAVGLEGLFVDIRAAFEEQLGVRYTACKVVEEYGFRVCHRDLMPGYGHVLMTVPKAPDKQVVSICVRPASAKSS